MKLSPEEKRKQWEVSDSAMKVDEYPYNLKIFLDCCQVEKLGIADLDVGKKLNLSAVVEIVSKSKKEVPEGQPNIDVCIQICGMEFDGKGKKSDKDVLYKD